MVWAKSWSGIRSGMIPVSAMNPALLTRMSTRPNVSDNLVDDVFGVVEHNQHRAVVAEMPGDLVPVK